MLKRIFIIQFLILICWLKLGNTIACNDNVYGVEVINDEACIEAIDIHLIPSIGFIIGQTYTFEAQVPAPVYNDVDDDIIWHSSSVINNSSNSSFTFTITDVVTIITVQVSYYYPNGNYTSTTYSGQIKITASQPPPPYTGICTELCPGVGLKSSGFEGAETEWKYTAGYLDTDGKYISFDPTLTNTIPSPEHTIINGANYNSFNSFNSTQGYNPFTSTNQRVLALGHGNTRNAGGVGGKNYYLARMEQTFFVGENYEPKLDIWYSWVASVAPTQSLKSKPVFSIKLFRFYEDRDAGGNIYYRQEEVYSHIDTENDYNQGSTTKRWKHWWDKKTIDLTPYKLERLRIEITSYDRADPSTDYNSMAFVDISCSSCCTPSEVATNQTQNLTVNPITNGIVNITRPLKICENPAVVSIAAQRCSPNYFYQIVDPNGEPQVLENNQIPVKFRPTVAGVYQIQYKEDSSCCWSDSQEFTVLQSELGVGEVITFSNDLKSAAISCIPSFEMDKVLAVNVASFGDRQLVDPKDIVTSNRKAVASEIVVTEPKNPYLTGERGIWRTEASYAYVTDREGYEEEENMNAVKEGGTFNLNMFNWTTQGVVPENWRRVNHVSRYDGYTHEIENRDILGRYSSALYGYNGQLATAVASNAAYYEIANEGFDAYQATEEVSGQQLYEQSCISHDGDPACIQPWMFSQIAIRSGALNGGTTYNVEPFPILGYEVGKIYAFSIEGQCVDDSQVNNTPYNDALDWLFASGILQLIAEDEKHIVVKVLPPSGATSFDISYNFQNSYLDACSDGGHSSIICYYRNSSEPIKTETNFEINNLYKDGDKDRNVILQVLWAKGNKGILEGYTPGEGATVTLDASVLAYTIGKQGAMDITPNLSVNTTDNEYTIDEKVKITLKHRDATTSWFTLEARNGYVLPEEWTQKKQQWYGSVRLARTLPFIGNTDGNNTRNYQALTPVAHTGNQGLAPSEDIIIQEKLLLIPDKEYVFSAWVRLSTAEEQPYTYGTAVGAALLFYENGSSTPIQSPTLLHPTGAIIEGWQRIEGTFVVPAKSMFVGVQLTGPLSRVVYDDVRIYPANGMMKTYVYNPSNYLLQAVLDENNYATLYFYDEEQRLYLVQKETREGVQTIQETRSYIKPKENE